VAVRKPQAEDSERDMAPRADETHAEWIERMKQIPGVNYHERDPDTREWTYKPSIVLARPIDVLVLLGRRNEDGSRPSDRA
jgi:hypothetical protein